jgi:hypothetical protein
MEGDAGHHTAMDGVGTRALACCSHYSVVVNSSIFFFSSHDFINQLEINRDSDKTKTNKQKTKKHQE